MGQISELQEQTGRINVSNGWTLGSELKEAYESGDIDVQRVVDHQIAVISLIMTEGAEAIKEIRNGSSVTDNLYLVGGTLYTKDNLPRGLDAPPKPIGLPSELADVVIRTLDFANTWGIDLEAAIIEKLEYNKSRGHRHGGKRL